MTTQHLSSIPRSASQRPLRVSSNNVVCHFCALPLVCHSSLDRLRSHPCCASVFVLFFLLVLLPGNTVRPSVRVVRSEPLTTLIALLHRWGSTGLAPPSIKALSPHLNPMDHARKGPWGLIECLIPLIAPRHIIGVPRPASVRIGSLSQIPISGDTSRLGPDPVRRQRRGPQGFWADQIPTPLL